MEEVYVDYILERDQEFDNDIYVSSMRRIYLEAVAVIPIPRVIEMIYAYTIARILYPGQHWRIMASDTFPYLQGRDMIVVGDEDATGGSILCSAKSVISIAEVSMSEQLSHVLVDRNLMTPDLEEDMIYGCTHRIYSPLSIFHMVFQEHPELKTKLERIIEKGSPTDILKLDAGGKEYLMYLDILLYRFNDILVKIFNKIPPYGCGTIFSNR